MSLLTAVSTKVANKPSGWGYFSIALNQVANISVFVYRVMVFNKNNRHRNPLSDKWFRQYMRLQRTLQIYFRRYCQQCNADKDGDYLSDSQNSCQEWNRHNLRGFSMCFILGWESNFQWSGSFTWKANLNFKFCSSVEFEQQRELKMRSGQCSFEIEFQRVHSCQIHNLEQI